MADTEPPMGCRWMHARSSCMAYSKPRWGVDASMLGAGPWIPGLACFCWHSYLYCDIVIFLTSVDVRQAYVYRAVHRGLHSAFTIQLIIVYAYSLTEMYSHSVVVVFLQIQSRGLRLGVSTAALLGGIFAGHTYLEDLVF